jgi:hypothetical protein
MRVLLIKPRPTAVQFGLAPFFQTEPLGLEYVASALLDAGHQVRIVGEAWEALGSVGLGSVGKRGKRSVGSVGQPELTPSGRQTGVSR